MNALVGNADPSQPEHLPRVTEINYPDRTVNRSYSGQGTVDLERESLAYSGMGAEAPYMLVDASGKRHFISPAHEGIGVMLTPAPTDEKPDQKRFTLLNLQAPTTVTLGERYFVPGVPEERQIREPIIRVDVFGNRRGYTYMLSSKGKDTSTRAIEVRGENPLIKVAPQFDKAIEKAKALGRIAR